MNIRLLLVGLIVLIGMGAVATRAFRAARRQCRKRPFLRPVLVVGALAVLAVVAWAVPRLGDLAPPSRSHPRGSS
jgi:hypothetical protein